MKTVTAVLCAQECVEVPDLECTGFDYCDSGSETTCFLTQQFYSSNGVTVSDDDNCDHYERKFLTVLSCSSSAMYYMNRIVR